MPRARAAVGTAVSCVLSSRHAESWKGIQACREEHRSQGSVPFLALPLTLAQHLEQDTSLQGNKSGFRGAAGSEAELIRAQTNTWSATDRQRYTAQRDSFSNSEELEAGGLNESPGSSVAKHRLELQVQGWHGWAKPRKQPWRGAGQAAAQKHPRPGLQEAEEPGRLCASPPTQQRAACWCHQHHRVRALPCTPPGLPQPPPAFQVLFLTVTPSERHRGRAGNTSSARPPRQCTASKQLSPSLGKDGYGPRAAGPSHCLSTQSCRKV